MAALAVIGLPAAALAQPRELQPSPAPASLRMLNASEANAIIAAAHDHRQSRTKDSDCSHLVHEIYQRAGFEYPFARSSDLHAGIEPFVRVNNPQRGDLITWPGHVGIVVDPALRAFYSSLRSGLRLEFYDTPYWRRRGRARFYRYAPRQFGLARDSDSSAKAPSGAVAKTREPGAGTMAAEANRSSSAIAPASAPGATGWPDRIPIPAAGDRPTQEEITTAIANLSGATATATHDLDLLNLQQPVLIVDRMEVESLEIKRQGSWVRIRTQVQLSITGGRVDFRPSRESRRWELRRVGNAWFLRPPAGRTYVHRDAAVRLLSAQLASLAQQTPAAARKQVETQQIQAVRVLGALVGEK